MLADYHVHSEFSDDSVFPVNDVCALAIERGIDEICFTDHVDSEIRPDWDEYRADPSCAPIIEGQPSINVDYERYFPTIAEARDHFAGKLTVKTGMEFGVQSHTIGRFDELFERFAGEWDFTILSIHQVGNQEFWNGTFQQGRTQDEYNMGYYEEMLRVAQRFDHWSVLGHLDLIKRYDQAAAARASSSTRRPSATDSPTSPRAPNCCACTATWAGASSRLAATRTSPSTSARTSP